jgi:hypothetical protein
VREVARAEQPVGLANDVAMDLDLLVAGGQRRGVLGEDGERHRPGRAGLELDAARVAAGVDRRVDERLERDARVSHPATGLRNRPQRARLLPACGRRTLASTSIRETSCPAG